MGRLAAVRSAAGRLDGLLGRAVYRAALPAGVDAHEVCVKLEAAVRARFEPDGFDVRAVAEYGTWFLHAHRRLTAGFMVGLVPSAGASETGVLVGVARSSRLDDWAAIVAGGCGVLAAALGLTAVAAAGVPLPGVAVAAIVLGVGLVSLLVAYQLLIPAVAALEFMGGGRLSTESLADIIVLVRGVIEADPGPIPVQPGTLADGGVG